MRQDRSPQAPHVPLQSLPEARAARRDSEPQQSALGRHSRSSGGSARPVPWMYPHTGTGTSFKCYGSHRWPHEPIVREYVGRDWLMVTRCQIRLIGSTGDHRLVLGTLLRPIHKFEFDQYERSLGQIDEYLHGPIEKFETAMARFEVSVAELQRLAHYPSADPGHWGKRTRDAEGDIIAALYSFALYIERMTIRVVHLYGRNSQEELEFARAFDSSFGYRLAKQIRNVVTHTDKPILSFAEPKSSGEWIPQAFLDKEVFLASGAKKEIKAEVRATDQAIDVIAMLRDLLPVVLALDANLKPIVYPDIRQDAWRVNSLSSEARRYGAFPQVVCQSRHDTFRSLPIHMEALNFAADEIEAWAAAEAAIWPSADPTATFRRLGLYALNMEAYDLDSLLGPVRVPRPSSHMGR